MKGPDPLTVRCPQCKAVAGARCRNYRGHACAPHATRTEAARDAAQWSHLAPVPATLARKHQPDPAPAPADPPVGAGLVPALPTQPSLLDEDE